jgi:hypothetical protein
MAEETAGAFLDGEAAEADPTSRIPVEHRLRVGALVTHLSFIVARMNTHMEHASEMLDRSNKMFSSIKDIAGQHTKRTMAISSDNLFIDTERMLKLIVEDFKVVGELLREE